MDVVTKATATVAPVESGDDVLVTPSGPGQFDVILSTAALDRDGDELHADEWKQPLPEHITFDSDHGMSVASCVGSGRPFINDAGQLQVRGMYASTDHAQTVRALVNEGHIRNVSVSFMTRKGIKSSKPERELLNGAFVAVPANPEAVVLASKSTPPADAIGASNANDALHGVEAVLRNVAGQLRDVVGHTSSGNAPEDANDADGESNYPHLQMIHDFAVQLGYGCTPGPSPAQAGQAWGANSPHIGSPKSFSGESAEPVEVPANAAASTASPDETGKALALEKMLAISLTAMD